MFEKLLYRRIPFLGMVIVGMDKNLTIPIFEVKNYRHFHLYTDEYNIFVLYHQVMSIFGPALFIVANIN